MNFYYCIILYLLVMLTIILITRLLLDSNLKLEFLTKNSYTRAIHSLLIKYLNALSSSSNFWIFFIFCFFVIFFNLVFIYSLVQLLIFITKLK